VSPNRLPFGKKFNWQLRPNRREEYLQLRDNPVWQSLVPYFFPRFRREVLAVLDRRYGVL